ncbi:hypothetical protein [Nocardioides coralli]|uniref:hypothetical protein n=1 Tax=Nocardioides coralli TaxID=2872154 RepID=UPI001CA46CF9|nr:hypothetical protein [Nocardioides coralli]QZY29704.1 hypothetical protein K6T13_03145 [Nocardioides coralli]
MDDLDDGVDPMVLGTGYALYRHGQDRLAAQITDGVRAALSEWDPGIPEGGSPGASEIRWGVAPVDLTATRFTRDWSSLIGQDHLRERFGVRVESALARHGRLPHTLLESQEYGMGKRHFARVLASLVDVKLVELIAPFPARALYDALALLDYRDILFIDEIDRIDGFGAAALTTLLEARTVQFEGEEVLASEITVIAGTVMPDALPAAVIDGFPVTDQLVPYTWEEMAKIAIELIFEHRCEELIDNTLASRIAGRVTTPAHCRRLVVAARDLIMARGECTIDDVMAMVVSVAAPG